MEYQITPKGAVLYVIARCLQEVFSKDVTEAMRIAHALVELPEIASLLNTAQGGK